MTDYSVGDTFDVKFSTRSFSTGAPTTLAGTPVVSAYPGNSTTQITAGITLTVDFDSVTGLHNVRVVATTGNGYASGSTYYLVITTGTVGGVSVVGEVIGEFTLGRSAAAVRVGTLATSASTGDPGTTTTLVAYLKQLVNILAGTAGITTFPAEAAPGNAVSLAEVIRAIHADVTGLNGSAMRGTDSAALASVCTEARLAELDAGNLPATTDSILTDTGTTLETHLTDIKGATFSGATDSLEAIRDRGDAAWTTGAGGTPPQLLQSTTIATLASQTSFTLTAGSADDDAYNGAIAVVTDSATSTQKAVGAVSDYVGSTRTVTLSADPAIFTMAVGDTIEIIAALGSGPTAAAIRSEIDANSTQLAAIVADTNELQGDWVNGGRLDLILDSRMAEASINTTGGAVDNVTLVATTTTNTDMRGTDSAATAASLATAQADLDILTGTDGVTLATSQPNYAPATAAALATTDAVVDNLNLGIIYGTAQTGTLSTTQATTDLTGYANDELIGRVIIFTGGTADGQASDITDYASASGLVTFTAITTAPANADTFKIV